MSKYLIKLTPHSTFFFGGENTFGEENANYFVKSNYFPQQTSLLGLIRYQLLLQSGSKTFVNNKIQNEENAKILIGKKSLDIEDKKFAFGIIERISPVFISYKDNNFLFHANKEYQWVDKENKKEINDFVFREFKKINKSQSVIYSEKEFIPYLEEYNPKSELPDLLVNKDLSIKKYYKFDSDKKDKPENGIFIGDKQVGIRKNYDGKSDEKAFYVQTFYRLDNGYSFCFLLELKDGTDFNSNDVVILGGEQSKFKMEVIPESDDIFKTKIPTGNFVNLIPNYKPSESTDKIILVSDAYANNGILVISDFAVTEIIDFRGIKSSIEKTKSYSALSDKDSSALGKTGKYNFFKKGSVLYGNTNDIKNKLENTTLQKIGYNIFKPIKKKKP